MIARPRLKSSAYYNKRNRVGVIRARAKTDDSRTPDIEISIVLPMIPTCNVKALMELTISTSSSSRIEAISMLTFSISSARQSSRNSASQSAHLSSPSSNKRFLLSSRYKSRRKENQTCTPRPMRLRIEMQTRERLVLPSCAKTLKPIAKL